MFGIVAAGCSEAGVVGREAAEDPQTTVAALVDKLESVTEEQEFSVISEAPHIGCVEGVCLSSRLPTYSNLSGVRLDARRALLEAAELDEPELPPEVVEQDLASVRRAAQQAIARGDETMLVSVLLGDPGLATAQLSQLRQEHRDEAIADFVAERREQLKDSQDAAAAYALSFGASEEGRSWLVNVIDIRVNPTEVEALLEMPGFVTMSPNAEASLATDGWVRQQAIGAVATDDQGAFGGRVGPEIRVGVIEPDDGGTPNRLNTGHVGWQDWAGGPSRVIDTDYCRWHDFVRDCSDSASDDDTPADHATRVASILMGSIEQGQDSAYTGTDTTEQNKRSGLAREAVLYYYRAGTPDSANIRVAIETAVSDGVDVINMSFGFTSEEYCSGTTDVASIRAALNAAENAGVVLVGAAGNECSGGTCGCNVMFPASHPDVISVAGHDAETLAAYGTHVLNGSSSRGWVTTTSKQGGGTTTTTFVDLTTYYSTGLAFNGGTDEYTAGLGGTSFAAPVVASLAALTREWMDDQGGGTYANDSYGVRINLTLSGDGQCNSSLTCNYLYTLDEDFGFGTVRYREPLASDMGSSWGWGWDRLYVDDDEEIYWDVMGSGAEGTNYTGYKAVFLADVTSYSNAPNLHIRLVDACTSPETVLRTATEYAAMWVLRETNTANIHNRCLRVRIAGEDVSSTITLWRADHIFSSSASLHFAD